MNRQDSRTKKLLAAIPLTKIDAEDTPGRKPKDQLVMIGQSAEDIEAEKIEQLRVLKMQRATVDELVVK